jgi:Cgr1 family
MASTLDFRFLDEGLGGEKNKKRKRTLSDDAAQSMDLDEMDPADAERPSKLAAIPSDDPNKPAFGRPTSDGVIAGRVSGRKWKQPRTQRASAKAVTLRPKSFELRAKEKKDKQLYKERIAELKEEIRTNKVEKRRLREEREKRKQENIIRSGTKFQKITNPKTLKKISKSRNKKLLKVVPDEIFSRGKKN